MDMEESYDVGQLLLPLAACLPCLIAGAIYLYRQAQGHAIPYAPLSAYLPGGEMYTLVTESKKTGAMMTALRRKLGRAFYARLGPNLTLFTVW